MAKRRRILAVSSGGGHWVELLRLRPAFRDYDVAYATVSRDYRADVDGARFHAICDATRWSKIALVRLVMQLTWILIRERPRVVISTGAAPGLLAIRLAKLFRAKTIWVDSIANAGELSLSGRLAGRYADLWLTQWPHLSHDGGPQCMGAVL